MVWRIHLGFNTKIVVGEALMSFVVHFVVATMGRKAQAKTNTQWYFHGLGAPWRALYFISLH
jgi:hypothetical protein